MQRIKNIASQEAKDLEATRTDELFAVLVSKTPAQVEEFMTLNMSPLIGMTESAVDNYVAGITTVAKAREAIGILAKDVRFSARMIRVMAKVIIILAKKI